MGAGLFWGIILIIIGLSIIFRIVFDINMFRVVIGVLLIFFGIKVLIGKNFFHTSRGSDVIFNQQKVTTLAGSNTEYNVIFGKAIYDLRDIEIIGKSKVRVELNAVFGSAELILNRDIPVKIQAESVFGKTLLPNGNSTSFGTIYYTSENAADSSSYLQVKASSVFGNIEIKQ